MTLTYDPYVDTGLDWLAFAACRDYDPEWWVLGPGPLNRNNVRATEICADCPVKDPCAKRPGDMPGMIVAGVPCRGAPQPRRPSKLVNGHCDICQAPFLATVRRRYCSTRCKLMAWGRAGVASGR